jgi:PAS domain S-box-containing protein
MENENKAEKQHINELIELQQYVSELEKSVTESKQAEEQIKEQAIKLQEQTRILDLAHVLIRDMDSKIIFWNTGAERLYGWTKKEAVGQVSDNLLKTVFPEPLEEIKSRLLTEKHWEGELIHTHREGSQVIVASHWELFCNEQGQPIAILEVDNDITKLKLAEDNLRKYREKYREHLEVMVEKRTLGLQIANEQLQKEITERKEVEKALQESQERYKNLVGAITAYTYSVEVREGRAISTKHSMGCAPVTGYNPEDYKADPYLWYSMIHPDDRIMIEISIKEILDGHEVPPIEHRIIRRDGKTVWVRNTMVPYYGTDGSLVRYDGLIEDITERKRAEEEIQKLNKKLGQHIFELTEANKELDAFNYSVSHDLQTPLIVIGGFIRRFLKVYGDNLDTNGIEMLNTVLMHTRKMDRLIKDLLSFSRLGRQKIKPAEIDMENLARAVLDELKPLSDGRIIKFDTKALPCGYGDAALIKQVFINLLSNAIKFTTPKDIAVIEVGYKAEENETIYYVKDNGIGFYPQYADKLFSIFHQLPGTKKFGGTGVGLSIVQRIINRHGGRVWAEGKVNEGATFYFTLPRKIVDHNG